MPCPRTSWGRASRAALGGLPGLGTRVPGGHGHEGPLLSSPLLELRRDFPREQMKGEGERGRKEQQQLFKGRPQTTARGEKKHGWINSRGPPCSPGAGVWECIRPRSPAGSSPAVWEFTRSWGIPAPPALPLGATGSDFGLTGLTGVSTAPTEPHGGSQREGAGRPPTAAPVCSQEAGWGGERHAARPGRPCQAAGSACARAADAP